MSYDVTVGGEYFNYTSNMSKFFKDFGVYPPDWSGVTRERLSYVLEIRLAHINSLDRRLLAEMYDAPNGWGSVDGAVAWLEKIYEACIRDTDTVEVEW